MIGPTPNRSQQMPAPPHLENEVVHAAESKVASTSKLAVTIALILVLAMVAASCASSWPGPVRGQGSAAFLAGSHQIRSIDILPADVQIWAHKRATTPEVQIGLAFDKSVASALPTMLNNRGYRVAANMGWNGSFINERGETWQAMTHDQVVETAWALSSFGDAVVRSGRTDLDPHLPHRLGHVSGADATLYVGGWAYAGKKKTPTAVTVLKVAAIVVVAVVVVVVIVASAKSSGKSSGKSASKSSSAFGKIARGAASGGKAVGRVAGGIGRAALTVTRTGAQIMLETARNIDTIHLSVGDPDYFGRSNTHFQVASERPDHYADKATPTSGESASMLEMTLVDNRTGEVLWHARQRFPANPKKSVDVAKMLAKMTAALPAAR